VKTSIKLYLFILYAITLQFPCHAEEGRSPDVHVRIKNIFLEKGVKLYNIDPTELEGKYKRYQDAVDEVVNEITVRMTWVQDEALEEKIVIRACETIDRVAEMFAKTIHDKDDVELVTQASAALKRELMKKRPIERLFENGQLSEVMKISVERYSSFEWYIPSDDFIKELLSICAGKSKIIKEEHLVDDEDNMQRRSMVVDVVRAHFKVDGSLTAHGHVTYEAVLHGPRSDTWGDLDKKFALLDERYQELHTDYLNILSKKNSFHSKIMDSIKKSHDTWMSCISNDAVSLENFSDLHTIFLAIHHARFPPKSENVFFSTGKSRNNNTDFEIPCIELRSYNIEIFVMARAEFGLPRGLRGRVMFQDKDMLMTIESDLVSHNLPFPCAKIRPLSYVMIDGTGKTIETGIDNGWGGRKIHVQSSLAGQASDVNQVAGITNDASYHEFITSNHFWMLGNLIENMNEINKSESQGGAVYVGEMRNELKKKGFIIRHLLPEFGKGMREEQVPMFREFPAGSHVFYDKKKDGTLRITRKSGAGGIMWLCIMSPSGQAGRDGDDSLSEKYVQVAREFEESEAVRVSDMGALKSILRRSKMDHSEMQDALNNMLPYLRDEVSPRLDKMRNEDVTRAAISGITYAMACLAVSRRKDIPVDASVIMRDFSTKFRDIFFEAVEKNDELKSLIVPIVLSSGSLLFEGDDKINKICNQYPELKECIASQRNFYYDINNYVKIYGCMPWDDMIPGHWSGVDRLQPHIKRLRTTVKLSDDIFGIYK
jgi:hypothetical protein